MPPEELLERKADFLRWIGQILSSVVLFQEDKNGEPRIEPIYGDVRQVLPVCFAKLVLSKRPVLTFNSLTFRHPFILGLGSSCSSWSPQTSRLFATKGRCCGRMPRARRDELRSFLNVISPLMGQPPSLQPIDVEHILKDYCGFFLLELFSSMIHYMKKVLFQLRYNLKFFL